MLGLAEVHQRKGDVEGRIAHMRAAAATSPADPGISLALAEALTDRDRPAEALGVLTRLADGRRMDSQLEERIRQAALDAEEPGEWLDSWARTTHLAPSAVRGAAFLSLVALLCAPLILALGIGLRRPSSPWGFGEAVVALGVALVGPVVALPVLVRVVPEASMSLEGTPSPETLLWVLIATVLGEALAVGLILVLAWRTPEGWGRLGWRRMAPRWLVRVAAVELVVIAAGATRAMWLSGTGLEGVSQDVARVFVRTGDPIALGAAAILAILLAPLFEEILFRGMLQSVFTVHFGSWAGIFMTAVVFGGMHLAEPLSVPPLIVLGLGAGWLREASGSLWPAVFLHVLNNFLAAGLSLASGVAVWGLI